MTSPAEAPIDAVLVGTVDAAPGSAAVVVGARLAVRHAGRLEVYDTGAFLRGGAAPRCAVDVPPGADGAPLGDGAVLAGPTCVRALDRTGSVRWEVPHPTWQGGPPHPQAPDAPAVSPDGTLVSVVVPALAEPKSNGTRVRHDGEGTRYGRDVLLLLDAATGRIRAARPVNSRASVVTQRWHPDGSLLALSCWTAWYSWSTWWIEPRRDGLHIRGGTRMREVIGFVAGSARALTLRRAELLAPEDDRDELAAHDISADEPVAVYDLAALAGRPVGPVDVREGSDEVFEDAHLLDGEHVLVTARPRPGAGARAQAGAGAPRHWLCDAATLRPVGRLRYPVPVGRVTPLGDGSWLTDGPRGFHHWSLS
ncbi:hypothetical protein [Streptomyces sp. NPDC047315]|uniref:hypothetical protein n=1 Tax=Streptomyces sp. NPDC047315 TaxID=3155142 RepID=UPI0033C69C56